MDYLNAKGRKVGMVQIHLYRPFSVPALRWLPSPPPARRSPCWTGPRRPAPWASPLYLDVSHALQQAGRGRTSVVVGGRYGLASKDTTPGQIVAVYDNLEQGGAQEQLHHRHRGRRDLHLPGLTRRSRWPHPGQVSCKIWGLGGDGTVGANKNAITTIGLAADKYAQAYFSYDSMKSGGLTQSHLRFGDEPIRATYLVSAADFVACPCPHLCEQVRHHRGPQGRRHLPAELPLERGGAGAAPARQDEAGPGPEARQLLHHRRCQAGTADLGLGKRTNNILQAAFFALTKVIPMDLAVEDMKKNNYNSYFKKAGQKIVDLNDQAVDLGVSAAVKVEIPASWADAQDTPVVEPKGITPFVRDIVLPLDRQQGDKLPVSVFQKHGVLDGTWENGTSAFSKRGVAVKVPKWDAQQVHPVQPLLPCAAPMPPSGLCC